jgi:hypothetical protein
MDKKPNGNKIVKLSDKNDKDILMKIFDKTNVAEVMKICLQEIYSFWPEDEVENWLIKRINEYAAVENFEIATDLLQRLTLEGIESKRTDKQEKRVFDLTLTMIDLIKREYDFTKSLGKALKALSVIIRYHPDLYNDKRVSLKDFLKKYQKSMGRDDYEALSAILQIIATVKDMSFTEDIEKLFQREASVGFGFGTSEFQYNIIGKLAATITTLEK